MTGIDNNKNNILQQNNRSQYIFFAINVYFCKRILWGRVSSIKSVCVEFL